MMDVKKLERGDIVHYIPEKGEFSGSCCTAKVVSGWGSGEGEDIYTLRILVTSELVKYVWPGYYFPETHMGLMCYDTWHLVKDCPWPDEGSSDEPHTP